MDEGQGRRPANQLNNREIVTEVRELHAQFRDLSEQYSNARPAERPELREQMEPLVSRENVLRQEYTGRASQELKQDWVPELKIELSR